MFVFRPTLKKMKTRFYSLAIVIALMSSITSSAQLNLDKIKEEADKALGGKKSDNGLSNDEVVKGLKEALKVGTNNSTASTAKVDGFYKNPMVKIPFPPEAAKVKSTLVNVGMKSQVDKFEMTLNRAAEEAAKEAAPIFINAITSMSIADGFNILKGADNAATSYLNSKTNAELYQKFLPVVKRATQKVSLTKAWAPLATNYNKIPGVQKQNPNLDDYVAKKAIEGLFKLIAQEELKIRKDPAARINDLLKKVFGSLTKK
jgi:hypothetical protein